MKYLIIIPGFMIGTLFGWLFFFALPLITFITIYYGHDSFMHPDALDWLQRPASLVGGILGASLCYIIAKEWSKK